MTSSTRRFHYIISTCVLTDIVLLFSMEDIQDANTNEDPSVLVLKMAEQYLPPDELQTLRDTLKAIADQDNSTALKMFDHSSISPGGAAFHIGSTT